jgi:hypothetical protein
VRARRQLLHHPFGRDSACRIDQMLLAKQFKMSWNCELFHGAAELGEHLEGLIGAGSFTFKLFCKLNKLNHTRARG